MTIRRHESGCLCAEVDAGRLTGDEVIRWMHQTGWPGRSRTGCRQWRDGEYSAWKARKEKQETENGKGSIVKITELSRRPRIGRRKARRWVTGARARITAARQQLAAGGGKEAS